MPTSTRRLRPLAAVLLLVGGASSFSVPLAAPARQSAQHSKNAFPAAHRRAARTAPTARYPLGRLAVGAAGLAAAARPGAAAGFVAAAQLHRARPVVAAAAVLTATAAASRLRRGTAADDAAGGAETQGANATALAATANTTASASWLPSWFSSSAPDDRAASYRGSSLSPLRTARTWSVCAGLLPKYWKVQAMEKDPAVAAETASAARRTLGAEVREALIDLGPAFVKLGQLLSTRVDLVPKDYIIELAKLQDQVPSFPGDVAAALIEEELGAPVEALFRTFDRTPLAAASLGQVHRATSWDGKELAIKVQREGLQEVFGTDLENMRILAQMVDWADNKDTGLQSDWVGIYEESVKVLYEEIDYINEMANAKLFAKNFAGTDWVKVPEVYENMTTRTVITMEYVPGIKITDIDAIKADGMDPSLLATRSAESYLTQLCRHGFFHSDPHPGNIACDNVNGGRLIYYDFGCMDDISEGARLAFVDLLFAIYGNEPKEAVAALEGLGCLNPMLDRMSIERIARTFLEEFCDTMDSGGKMANAMPPDEWKVYKRRRRSEIGQELFTLGTNTPVKMPTKYTFVYRAFTSLDGIGKQLTSKYDLTKLAQPFLKELLDLRDGSALMSFAKTVGKTVGLRPVDISAAVTGPRKVAYIEDVVRRLETGDLNLRVRAPEAERAMQRVQLSQSNTALMLTASAMLNVGVLLLRTGAGGAAALPAAAAGALISPAADLWLARGTLLGASCASVGLVNGLRALRTFDTATAELGMMSALPPAKAKKQRRRM